MWPAPAEAGSAPAQAVPPEPTFEPIVQVSGIRDAASWLNLFRDWLERNKFYPRDAAALGEQGPVRLRIIVEPDGRPCPCGGRGCLEAYCSGSAIEQETGRSPLRAPAAIIERSGLLLGRALASVAAVVDLRLAVVGGTIALSYGEPFFTAANTELAARAKLAFLAGLQVVPSQLGTAAPLIGAASLARQVDTAPAHDGSA